MFKFAPAPILGCLVIVLLTISGGSWRKEADGGWPTAPLAGVERPPIILISLDTLRADRLGCYGYTRPTSPNLDAFAAESVRFANVVSESCWTLPSHMTLFTGLYPTTHGVKTPRDVLSPKIPLLTEILKKAGYRTCAVTAGVYVAAHYGFGRGFDEYTALPSDGFAAILDRALKHIDKQKPDEPFFLFIHTYDIHSPYNTGEAYADLFHSPEAVSIPNWGAEAPEYCKRDLEVTPGYARFLSDRYDACIRQADEHLGDFLMALKSRGLLERAVLVVASDHGEEFGEHGSLGHRGRLYREHIQPPVLIHAPGVSPRVVEEGIGLKDVFATLLDFAKADAPPNHGRSLIAAMRGEAMEDHPLFSEVDDYGHLRSLVWKGRHLILQPFNSRAKCFDWRVDSTEQRDCGDEEREWVEELRAQMPEPPDRDVWMEEGRKESAKLSLRD